MGITSVAFALNCSSLPNKFIDGGITGVSLLISAITYLSLYVLLLLLNSPFIFLRCKLIDQQFAIKTALAITGLTCTVAFIHFSEVTPDKLLVAAF